MKTWLVVTIILLSSTALAQSSQPPIVPPDQLITGYTLPPDKLAKATALYDMHVRLLVVDTLYGFLLLLAFLYGRIGSGFRDIAKRFTKRVNLQGFVYLPLVLVSLATLELPIKAYSHRLSRMYGLSIQGWGSWLGDWAKGVALLTLLGTLVISLAYWLMRKSPRRGWFYFWLTSVPILLFVIFLLPLVIEPMFNHFDPLEPRHPALAAEIEKVLQHGRMAISPSRMFEMRASEKATTLNAYVTGLGASKRVVIWDNTIQKLTTPQILYVFGHEMGHYALHHIWKGLAFAAVLLLAAFYLGANLGQWAVTRYGSRWGIGSLSDWASMPLLILIISLFDFFSGPLSSTFSRHLEHQADLYGMEVIHGIVPNPNQTAAQSFQALGENSLSYPHPNRLLIFWTYDHPAISDRVQFVLRYKPWQEGKQPKYVK
jgi:STE24 endopeptidase